MTFTPGHAKRGGRARGQRNHKTIRAEQFAAGALDHLRAVMASTDGTITPELKVRAAIALAQYAVPKPPPLRVLATPLDLPPPTNAQEAREQIAKVTSMMAQGEIDADIGRSIVIGLQAFVGCIAAELEAEVEELRAGEDNQ
jgi:hypothetical protein